MDGLLAMGLLFFHAPFNIKVRTVNDSRLGHRLSGSIFTAFLIFSTNAYSQQTVQPGFVSHEPTEVEIRISDASSGYVCGDEEGSSNVCEKAIKIFVTDEEMCNSPDGTQYPCTRYGYQFDYQGADPSVPIHCKFERHNPSPVGPKPKTEEYAVELTADQGHIFHPSFTTYTPVNERVIFSEVHECFYGGAQLTTIEFILYLEPERAVFGQCGQPGFDNFRVPANLPASAGTVSTPKDGASWDVTNFVGKMDCGAFNMPLTPNRESGSIEVQDNGDTLIARHNRALRWLCRRISRRYTDDN